MPAKPLPLTITGVSIAISEKHSEILDDFFSGKGVSQTDGINTLLAGLGKKPALWEQLFRLGQ
jgi:hypothetical protein